MKVQQVIIAEHDLKKLCEDNGIKIKQLAKVSGVNYEHILRCIKGKFVMRQDTWDKIKSCL